MTLFYAFSGLAVRFIVGLTGVGGVPVSPATVHPLKSLAVDTGRLESVITTSLGAARIPTAAALLLVDRNPRQSTLRVVGTDIAHAVPPAFVAGFGHAAIGNRDR
jgi:hypothetical protein